MKRTLIIFVLGFLAIASYTQVAQAATSCPTQTFTVTNNAHVRPWSLVLVEIVTMMQSQQIHAAWGTPCVTFGQGGWPITLTTGTPIHNDNGSVSYTVSGRHCGAEAGVGACYSPQPALSVQTGGLSYKTWARAFTHEVAEALADPTDNVHWKFGLEEICDPVQDLTYELDGVAVADFVTPAYFSGAPGPYDQMNTLTSPGYGLTLN